MKRFAPLAVVLALAATMTAACSGPPAEAGLRESFAQQLAANRFVKDFAHHGDDLTFSGPGSEGGVATWRVHIDSAVIEPTSNPGQPFKGTVKASWYSNDRIVIPRGRESNLPLELISNGLGQECWAFWEKDGKRWSWE